MTALELRQAGFSLRGDCLFGPSDRPDVVEQLRAEVARRMPLPERQVVPQETCETCGDRLLVGRNGQCDICCLAVVKTIQAKKKAIQ